MIGQTVSHYSILEKLGEGGMGVVYKARDTKLDRTVALKFLPPRLAGQPDKSRFLQEAKSASALNHPNICTIYYLEEIGDESFIVMELVEGVTLRDRLPLKSVSDAVDYAVQIAEALHEAHGKGIVHRDIKSDNIMINARNQVKVMDFGLARIKGSLRLTRSSSTVGTLAYMAPEQVRGEDVDPRSDVFSFGVVLFEMLTGVLPFKGEHEAAVMYSVLNEEPEMVEKYRKDVPPALGSLIQRCLEKDPADRYQHADDLASELRRIRKQSTRVTRAFTAGAGAGPSGELPSGGLATGAPSQHDDSPARPQSSAAQTAAAASPSPSAVHQVRKRPIALVASAIGMLVLAAAGYFVFGPDRGGSGSAEDDRRMLVVLPFENLGSADQEYFADGITEEITGKLSGISGLGVIAASSARPYKKTTKPLSEIGAELGVDYALQGTIRWNPGDGGHSRVRVTPALIRLEDGTQVWSQSFNAVVSDVFSLQTDIASQVAGAMGVSLLTPEKESLGKKPTENAEAYELYLRGNEYYRRSYRKEDIEIALDMYSRAVEKDPRFALAWSYLSECHAAMYWHHHDHTDSRVEKAKAAVDRALELDPVLPEAHRSLGYYYYWAKLDYENALSELYVALKGRPNDGQLLLGIAAIQRRQGKMHESIASNIKAIELDPRRPEYLFNVAQTMDLVRDFARAEDHIGRAISLSPELAGMYEAQVRILIHRDGNTTRAREAVKRASRLADYQGTSFMVAMAAHIEVLDDNYAEAARIVETSLTEPVSSQFVYYPKNLVLALIHDWMKDGKAPALYEAARREIEAKIASDSADPRYPSALGIALAGLGRKQEAIAAGKKGMALLPLEKEAWRGSSRMIDMARIFTMTGEKDAAVEMLGKLLSIPSALARPEMKIDPAWDSLRDHPGFIRLMSAS